MSNIKDYLKNTPPQYTSSFDDIRKVLGGQSELAGDMHQAGHLNKASLDFLLEDVMTVVSKDSSLSERALAGFFLVNKHGKVVDRVYDGIGKKIDGVLVIVLRVRVKSIKTIKLWSILEQRRSMEKKEILADGFFKGLISIIRESILILA